MQSTSEERARLEAVFRAHHAAVRAYVRRRAPVDEVDDIVSEVFLVAWRRLDDVPADGALPWLIGVARNTLGTARRGNARRQRLSERAQAGVDTDVADVADSFDLHDEDEVIRAALTRLNPSDREALTLIAWEGLTPSQAAEALGIPANRFRVRLHRASRRLRWAIEKESEARNGLILSGHVTRQHTSQGAPS